MLRSLFLPLIALSMFGFAAQHIARRQKPELRTEPPLAPSVLPFQSRVAGAGIVESATENIAIGTHLPGVVAKVLVQVGATVRTDDILFELDTRQAEADLGAASAQLASRQAELDRQLHLPRTEDLPPLVAQREQAQALVRQWQDQSDRQATLAKRQATDEATLIVAREQLAAAKAQLAFARSNEARLLAGAWEPDLAIARAAVAQSQADLQRQQTRLELHRVLSPRFSEGTDVVLQVLQVNVRPGEAVDSISGKALMTLGDVRRKRVRVDIDEHDVTRFREQAPAVGVVRGGQRQYALNFIRVEPFILPKRSLTGDNTERVDTRVLQVIYEVVDGSQELFVGQQMDISIEAQL